MGEEWLELARRMTRLREADEAAMAFPGLDRAKSHAQLMEVQAMDARDVARRDALLEELRCKHRDQAS